MMSNDDKEDRFSGAKVTADGLLSAGDIEGALRTYHEFAQRPGMDSASKNEALFHLAMIQENFASRLDDAFQLYVALSREGHAGATKAAQRIVEARWSAARESSTPAARAELDRILAMAPDSCPIFDQARAWLVEAQVEDRLAEAQRQYDGGAFARAASLFEEAAQQADGARLMSLASKARSRAAAIFWYSLVDRAAALRVIAAMGPSHWATPAVKAILDRVTESLAEELRILIRRGDREEAFVRLQAAYRTLSEGMTRRQDLACLFLSELSSQHMLTLDSRMAGLARRIEEISADLSRTPGSGQNGPVDRADEVAAGLQLCALREEQSTLESLREQMSERELSILNGCSPEEYYAHQRRSREDMGLATLLDKVHRLALERMHYRTRWVWEPKDRLTAVLPRFLSARLTDEVFLVARTLEEEIARKRDEFLRTAYP